MRRAPSAWLAAALVPLVLTTACGAEPPDSSQAARDEQSGSAEPGGGPFVVAMVAPLTDLTAQVMGDRGEVVSLVPAGHATHTFEPSPGDAARLADADLFVGNGLGLNDAALRLAEANLPPGAPVQRIGEQVLTDEEVIHAGDGHDHGDGTSARKADGSAPNPHAWMSVDHAMDYVRTIRDALVAVDPDGRATYQANADEYLGALDTLHQAIAKATATIPPENRRLVVYHDSLAYFAPAYGLELVAAVQPSDHSEPSASELRTLIEDVRSHDVPAVFGSKVFASDVIETIAAETGTTYIGDLEDDVLPGRPGDPEHSYVGLMLTNAKTIVEGLGGDTAPLEAVTLPGD